MLKTGTDYGLPRILAAVLLCQFFFSDVSFALANGTTSPPTSTSISSVSPDKHSVESSTSTTSSKLTSTTAPSTTAARGNATDFPGSLSTIHLLNATAAPSVADNPLTTGQITGIAIAVVVVASVIGIAILCLRKKRGYKKAVSAPVTYRKGTYLRADRAPLTTRDKDPSPPPATLEDQFFIEDDHNRRLKTVSNGHVMKPKRHEQEDAMSVDGETTLARDGGDDDYFYDEIFGKSAFTDEKTSASIKELSSPKPDDDWPDLIFDDDPFS